MQSQAPHTLAARNVLWSWFLALTIGTAVSAVVVMATGNASQESRDIPVWVTGLSVLGMWSASLVVFGRTRPESPRVNRQLTSWFNRKDFYVGFPLGIFCQYILVTTVTWPLSKVWPSTFSSEEVSKRATDLTNTAPGAWMILLVLIVVVGAPFVEEVIYRGTVQPDLVNRWGTTVGVVVTAFVFAAIHQSPVEFAGLFAFALVLGVARHRTGRLGTSIITHMAFNAAGLVLVILN